MSHVLLTYENDVKINLQQQFKIKVMFNILEYKT